MTLRVLHINLHKSRLASAELLIALEQGPVDIALVQEPWIASGNIVAGLRSSNYNTSYSPTIRRNRSAVLVWDGIYANLMSHYSSDDLTTVMLESEEQRLLVASCYMAHDRLAPPNKLSTLVEFDDQLLIGADANAYHSVKGSSDINDRGESLLNFILSTNLYIANVVEEHTWIHQVPPRQTCL